MQFYDRYNDTNRQFFGISKIDLSLRDSRLFIFDAEYLNSMNETFEINSECTEVVM